MANTLQHQLTVALAKIAALEHDVAALKARPVVDPFPGGTDGSLIQHNGTGWIARSPQDVFATVPGLPVPTEG